MSFFLLVLWLQIENTERKVSNNLEYTQDVFKEDTGYRPSWGKHMGVCPPSWRFISFSHGPTSSLQLLCCSAQPGHSWSFTWYSDLSGNWFHSYKGIETCQLSDAVFNSGKVKLNPIWFQLHVMIEKADRKKNKITTSVQKFCNMDVHGRCLWYRGKSIRFVSLFSYPTHMPIYTYIHAHTRIQWLWGLPQWNVSDVILEDL